MSKEFITRVWFRYKGKDYPILRVDETFKNNQNLITFTSEPSMPHITIHYKEDGVTPKLSTHIDNNKPPSVWDLERVAIAKELGYKDPERHAKYYHHAPLLFCKTGAHLAGRGITIDPKMPIKRKYYKDNHLVINTKSPQFMLHILYSNTQNPTDLTYDNNLILRKDRGILHFAVESLQTG